MERIDRDGRLLVIRSDGQVWLMTQCELETQVNGPDCRRWTMARFVELGYAYTNSGLYELAQMLRDKGRMANDFKHRVVKEKPKDDNGT